MHGSENEAKCRVRCHTRMCRYRGQTKDSSLYTLANVSIALCEGEYRYFGNGLGEPCSARWHTLLNTSPRTATVASIVDRFEKTHHVYYVVVLHDDTLFCHGDREKLLREGRGMRQVRGNGFKPPRIWSTLQDRNAIIQATGLRAD
jgi:hypothetical protein